MPDEVNQAKEAGRRNTSRTVPLMLGGILLVAVVLMLAQQIPGRSVEVAAGSSGVSVKLGADGRLDIAALLQDLSADRINKDGTFKWLKENWGLYALDDPALVAALSGLCPPAPTGNIEAYQQHLDACERHEVLRQLRVLSLERKAPFQRKARPVRLGTPARNQPRDGEAYTCYESEWENRRLRLVPTGSDADQGHVEVTARGAFECVPGQTFPDLQINAREALRLFGRSTRAIEMAVAQML